MARGTRANENRTGLERGSVRGGSRPGNTEARENGCSLKNGHNNQEMADVRWIDGIISVLHRMRRRML
jgi:hypothetical protein